MSNSTEVLARIPENDCATEINLSKGYLPTTKTLGILWIADDDCFTFRIADLASSTTLTKHVMLKNIARLFDPVGFLSPYIITGKVLLQEIWSAGYNWNEELDLELQNK